MRLPTERPEFLNPIKKLTDRENYEEWAYMVKSQLRIYCLQHLISTELLKLTENGPRYEDWEELSYFVQNWLITQIDSSIFEKPSLWQLWLWN